MQKYEAGFLNGFPGGEGGGCLICGRDCLICWVNCGGGGGGVS